MSRGLFTWVKMSTEYSSIIYKKKKTTKNITEKM